MSYAYDDTNIFARILRGEIPNRTLLETPHTLAFHDMRERRPDYYDYPMQAQERHLDEKLSDYSDRQSDDRKPAAGPMTDSDKAILRDLDLLDDDEEGSAELPNDFCPVLRANPLESFSLERERSLDRERSREGEKTEARIEASPSRSPDLSLGKKRRLKRADDPKEAIRPGQPRGDIHARLMDKKLENLKRHTEQLGDRKTRRASESTKPSLNLMIPKDFENKESFSRRFKVLESLGEGGSSIVRKVSCRRDGKICAVKSCKSNDSSNTKYIKKELKILQYLSHPNIIKPYGIFESTSNVGSV